MRMPSGAPTNSCISSSEQINNTGSITLSGAETKSLFGVLNNAGTIVHAGNGDLELYESTLNNLPGSLYDLQGDGNFTRSVLTTTVFNNAGTLRKSAGNGLSANTFGVRFNNLGGTIDVQAGAFVMTGGDSTIHTGGTFRVADGSPLFDRVDQHRRPGL